MYDYYECHFIYLAYTIALTYAFHLLHSYTHSYSGLVSFWIAREINNDKKKSKKWIKRGVECKDEIEKLSVSASKWNFQNSECRNLHVVIFLYLSILYLVLCSLTLSLRSQRLIFSKPKSNLVI